MMASVVPRGLVSEAMSKIVSSVIGAGSGTSRRQPYARCRRISSPRPTRTTIPGISPEAIASFAASSTPVKSGAWVAGSGGSSEGVVHLVGIIREHLATTATFDRVHVQGTLNVIAAAAPSGVRRYVHMSALGAREDARSRYHQTKWLAEEVVRACPLPWTIFRPSVIYGRGDGFVFRLERCLRRLPVLPLG